MLTVVRSLAFADMAADSVEAPPTEHVLEVFTILVAVVPLLTAPDHVDQILVVLIDLIKRDEETLERQLGLGDKVAKWVTAEVDKVSSPTKT